MVKRDLEYRADKGKHFVLTEFGKANSRTYSSYEVGKPVCDEETWCPAWAIDEGYLIEVDDPDWIVTDGWKVVYYHKNGTELSVGNPHVFFDKETAERYAKGYKKNYSWWRNREIHVLPAVYEGKRPTACREYNGKRVFNWDFWTYEGAEIGDLVEAAIMWDAINAVPPACMRSDCMQCGEPSSTKIDENGKERYTYATFKKITENIYEWCGDCFKGMNTESGTPIPIV